jgi:hypothetical protein
MNNNAIERTGSNVPEKRRIDVSAIARSASADDEWRLMNAALERLGQVEAREQAPARRGGRLIFGLDLTGSREPSLRQARIATAAMFDTIKALGAVAVKLIYYRGASECRAGEWHDDPGIVSAAMLRLSCRSGYTQIRKILRHALNEKEQLSGLILIVDHCEETDDGYELDDLAVKLGQKGVPIFVFHECSDHDRHSLEARPIFEHIAKVSGGVYTEFKPDSGAILRELLATVAAFSAAGHEGLKQVGQPLTPEARQLRGSLLLLTDGNPQGGTK